MLRFIHLYPVQSSTYLCAPVVGKHEGAVSVAVLLVERRAGLDQARGRLEVPIRRRRHQSVRPILAGEGVWVGKTKTKMPT